MNLRTYNLKTSVTVAIPNKLTKIAYISTSRIRRGIRSMHYLAYPSLLSYAGIFTEGTTQLDLRFLQFLNNGAWREKVSLEPEENSRGALLYEILPPGCKPPLARPPSPLRSVLIILPRVTATQRRYCTKYVNFDPFFLMKVPSCRLCGAAKDVCWVKWACTQLTVA